MWNIICQWITDVLVHGPGAVDDVIGLRVTVPPGSDGSKTDFKNVIGRISIDKLHLCEPGLRLRLSVT